MEVIVIPGNWKRFQLTIKSAKKAITVEKKTIASMSGVMSMKAARMALRAK